MEEMEGCEVELAFTKTISNSQPLSYDANSPISFTLISLPLARGLLKLLPTMMHPAALSAH